MKHLLLFPIVLFSIFSFGQKKAANPKPFAESITDAELKKQLYIVAGKEMEGRETATEGQKKAASYIEDQFKAMGLLPGNNGSFQLTFPVYRDSIVKSRMIVNGKELKMGEDFQPSLNFGSSNTMFFSEVTFAGYGIVDSTYSSYGTDNVRGKAVLIADGKPEGFTSKRTGFFGPATTFGKILSAQEKGAAAIFLVVPALRPLSMGNMYVNLFKAAQSPAVYSITEKTAEILFGPSWASMKADIKPKLTPVKMEVQLELNKKLQKMQSSNVLGAIEGTDKKNEYLIVTAHYDHLGKRGDVINYGADDDGSGTVGVIEIARAFQKAKAAGKGPRRSIIFMTVSGEEKGLWGSEYYTNHPTVNPEMITANLNIDMIGRVDTERKKADTLNYIYVVGDDKLSTDLKPLSESVNNKYSKLYLDYKFNDPKDPERIYFRSNHYNVARIGGPIIVYYDGMRKADYHKPTDTPDKINYKLLAKRAQLVFYTAWEMANREAMMKRDIPLPKME
ncbi:MAG TPA: M28 family peptidase [Cyclobacteriaceae bacterium]|nr:M28 family peptidase [Cyclobacteriaceae bacterium]